MNALTAAKIRGATSADTAQMAAIQAEGIEVIIHQALSDPAAPKLNVVPEESAWSRRLGDSEATNLVLDLHGLLVGLVSFGPTRERRGDKLYTGEIHDIYVSPSISDRGPLRLLCETALDALREQGFGEVVLRVFEGDDRAQSFYQSLGFVRDEGQASSMVLEDIPGNETGLQEGARVQLSGLRYKKSLRE